MTENSWQLPLYLGLVLLLIFIGVIVKHLKTDETTRFQVNNKLEVIRLAQDMNLLNSLSKKSSETSNPTKFNVNKLNSLDSNLIKSLELAQNTANTKSLNPVIPDYKNLHTLQLMVLSKPGDYKLRNFILKDNWATNSPNNVNFFIGDKNCLLPENLNKEFTCLPDQSKIDTFQNSNPLVKNMFKEILEMVIANYIKENETTSKINAQELNLVRLNSTENYRNLPLKIKKGYEYILNKYPNAEWIGKIDMDQYVRVEKLENYGR